ncbi:MAG: transposase [Clostridiales bacterium]|nr:transposase [Clostridiales bacterium]
MEKIAGWRYSGFSVHSKFRAQTRKEAERVGKYIRRPLLSLERLSFSEKEGQVCRPLRQCPPGKAPESRA